MIIFSCGGRERERESGEYDGEGGGKVEKS